MLIIIKLLAQFTEWWDERRYRNMPNGEYWRNVHRQARQRRL